MANYRDGWIVKILLRMNRMEWPHAIGVLGSQGEWCICRGYWWMCVWVGIGAGGIGRVVCISIVGRGNA